VKRNKSCNLHGDDIEGITVILGTLPSSVDSVVPASACQCIIVQKECV